MNNTQTLQNLRLVALAQRNQPPYGFKSFLSAVSSLKWFTRKKQVFDLQDQVMSKDAEIARLKWELLQRTEQLKNITYYQSHMVRRPLANILGIAELMKDNPAQGDPEVAELISLLRISADELDKAIKSNSQGV